MTESTEKLNQQHVTKLLNEVVEDVRQWQDSREAPVWFAGHGTGHDDVEDFFRDGVIMGSHDSLFETAIPLDVDDADKLKDKLDHWQHRDSPKIVLLAAQSPEDFNPEGPWHKTSLWMDGLIQKTEKYGREMNHIPSEWIRGVYDRATGEVAMNPNFTGREVTQADMENSGGIRYNMAALGGTALDGMGGEPAHQPVPKHPPSGDIPAVW